MPNNVSKGPIASTSKDCVIARLAVCLPKQSLFVLLVFFANTIGPLPQAHAQEFSLPAPGESQKKEISLVPKSQTVVLI